MTGLELNAALLLRILAVVAGGLVLAVVIAWLAHRIERMDRQDEP